MVDVSVIIPVFNRIGTIGRAIDSILNQSFQGKIEIIVSDDGSTDGTIEYIKDNYLNRVVLLEKTVNEQGASAARNRGIKVANGEYVCFLDSDDFYKNFTTNSSVDNNTQDDSQPFVWIDESVANGLIL